METSDTGTVPEMTKEQAEYVAGMYAAADFFAEHPHLIQSYWSPHVYNLFADDVADMARLAREAGGKFDKKPDQIYFVLERKFSARAFLRILVTRSQSCERVEVGRETVMVADPSFKPPMIPEERVIYEWRCPDALLRGDEEDHST